MRFLGSERCCCRPSARTHTEKKPPPTPSACLIIYAVAMLALLTHPLTKVSGELALHHASSYLPSIQHFSASSCSSPTRQNDPEMEWSPRLALLVSRTSHWSTCDGAEMLEEFSCPLFVITLHSRSDFRRPLAHLNPAGPAWSTVSPRVVAAEG